MITIKEFNKLILDNKILITYRDPNDSILCHNFDTPENLKDRQVIRIINAGWLNTGTNVINVLVSICDD